MTTATVPARWPARIQASNEVRNFIAPTLGIDVPASDDSVFKTLLDTLVMEDTLAINLVREEQANKTGKEHFEVALKKGLSEVSAPSPALSEFFSAVEQPPGWADTALMAEAGQIHFRLGRVGQLSSSTLGLLAGYRNSAVAKTLCATTSLATATPRRLAETAKFIFDVCDSDGMGRFSEGYQSAIRVRRVHAYVRNGLARSPNWRPELWGPPVSIMDSLGTSMAFWVPSVLSQKKLGHTLSRDEQFALMTLWNYVGYLQGVPESLLPQNLEDCYKIYCCLQMVFPPADQDSKTLAASLMAARGYKDGSYDSAAAKIFHGAVAGLLPQDYLTVLGIPSTPYKHILKYLKLKIALREARIRRDPSYLTRVKIEGRASMQAAFGSIEATFDPAKVIKNQQAIS